MSYTDNQRKIIEGALRIVNEKVAKYGVGVNNPDDAKSFVGLHLADAIAESREQFIVVLLNNKHRLIGVKHIGCGTLTESAVYPREVAKTVLANNAAAVVFAHNHPSGDIAPSDADIRITRHLVDALGMFDCRVLDHIIVADTNRVRSMAEHGDCSFIPTRQG